MGQRRLPDDFRDFLSSLNKNKVKYLLLGGWAVGIEGMIRYGFRTTAAAIAA
jgi:hypothetical protein